MLFSERRQSFPFLIRRCGIFLVFALDKYPRGGWTRWGKLSERSAHSPIIDTDNFHGRLACSGTTVKFNNFESAQIGFSIKSRR